MTAMMRNLQSAGVQMYVSVRISTDVGSRKRFGALSCALLLPQVYNNVCCFCACPEVCATCCVLLLLLPHVQICICRDCPEQLARALHHDGCGISAALKHALC
jgi:hypothetical protein